MRWPTMVVGLLLGSASLAQDVPDVVVTGERLQVAPGLWRLQQFPGRGVSTMTANGGSKRRLWTVPGWERRVCIPAAELEEAIRRLLQAEADRTMSIGCSRFRIRIGAGRITARRDCSSVGGAQIALTYGGTLRPSRLDVQMVRRVTDRSGDYGSELDSRLIGERIGECAGAPRPAPSTAVAPVPAPVASATPVPPPEEPVEARAAPAPMPHGEADAPAHDVVVVARRLRKLRLHYSSSGGALRWCHADLSSGDKRLDRIGCAIVRACVREGFEEEAATLRCFNRKVDLVEAPARP